MTFKTELGFVQGRRKWHHWIDRIRVPVRLPYYLWRCLVSSARYSDLLVENREMFIPHLYLSPPQGVTSLEFREDVWCCWKQNDWATVWWKNHDDVLSRFHLIPERYRQTDRQTDLLYQYRASVCWCAIKTEIFFFKFQNCSRISPT